jgi:CxxC motif-containing protein (DUF1111 family)
VLRSHPGADTFQAYGPAAEAEILVRWRTSSFTYADGSTVELRAPEIEIRQLGYGELHPEARATLRHAPSLVGVGLLDRVPLSDLEALVDPEDHNGDGISGRLNRVWNPTAGEMQPGRFGWKANQPTLRAQIAAAFAGDMGITSAPFPEQPCTKAQRKCLAEPTGNDANGHEISEELLDLVVFFNASLGVPERRKPDDPLVLSGKERFHALGCAACHVPQLRTSSDPEHPHLSEQDIWPYTDLLLHDLGADLADGRADFEATSAEWRTPPLWGVGLALAVHDSVGFLHDGRARTLEEAIVWHGGEASNSRDGFARSSMEERRAVIAFVRSL